MSRTSGCRARACSDTDRLGTLEAGGGDARPNKKEGGGIADAPFDQHPLGIHIVEQYMLP